MSKPLDDESGGKQHEYASPPCYSHEVDPDYMGLSSDSLPNPSSSAWERVNAWRKQTRSQLRALREDLKEQANERCSSEVITQLKATELPGDHRKVGCYWPLAGEVDLRPLISDLFTQGVQVALPAIIESSQSLEFWRWVPGQTLCTAGRWGIPTPQKPAPLTVSVLLIPLLGFDKDGYRLGNGGGYYDRTLAKLSPRPLTIGIGLECTRLHTIYPQAHDIAMDYIVTEAGVYKTNTIDDPAFRLK